MKTAHWTLAAVSALAVAACGQPAEQAVDHDMAHDGHAAMEHHAPTEAGELAPLPDDGVTPVIAIRAAWIRPHPQGRDVTAAYFTARLDEGSADRLLSATIAGADRVELHGHTIGEGGMMQMRAIGPQDLAGEGPMVFTPGGRHLMVFGLDPVAEGETVEGVLVFERAGEVPVSFAVRAAPPGMPTEY